MTTSAFICADDEDDMVRGRGFGFGIGIEQDQHTDIDPFGDEIQEGAHPKFSGRVLHLSRNRSSIKLASVHELLLV
ncbi:MAG TPA: hypothetical protein VIP51_09685 [Eoetvoesiella sp.]